MTSLVSLEQWSRLDGPLHRRDPRAKVLVLLAFLVCVNLAAWPQGVGALALLALLTLASARLPILPLLRRALVAWWFAMGVALVHAWAGEWPRAAAVLARTYVAALAALLVVATTPWPRLLQGLERLGVPAPLATVVGLLLRYVFVVGEQAQRMRTAAACRGGLPAIGWRGRFRLAAGLVAVLFARSLARAERTHRSMLARGYQGRLPVLVPLRWVATDSGLLAAGVALCAGVWWASR